MSEHITQAHGAVVAHLANIKQPYDHRGSKKGFSNKVIQAYLRGALQVLVNGRLYTVPCAESVSQAIRSRAPSVEEVLSIIQRVSKEHPIGSYVTLREVRVEEDDGRLSLPRYYLETQMKPENMAPPPARKAEGAKVVQPTPTLNNSDVESDATLGALDDSCLSEDTEAEHA